MPIRTVHGRDKVPLWKPTREELVKAWRRAFGQNAPAEATARQLHRTIVVSTSSLRLDYEISRQRGYAIEGEVVR
jgi:hypothetical protein